MLFVRDPPEYTVGVIGFVRRQSQSNFVGSIEAVKSQDLLYGMYYAGFYYTLYCVYI